MTIRDKLQDLLGEPEGKRLFLISLRTKYNNVEMHVKNEIRISGGLL
jgi:hypothetical protein